jgi:hypothetical protein
MSELPVFSCYHCHGTTGNPHSGLDRRVVRRTVGERPSQPQVILEVIEDQELFTYCNLACWHGHEGSIVLQLQLGTTYPPDGPVVPCSRCGSPVVRAMPHVVYAVSTMRLTNAPDTYVGEVLYDSDFAILCSRCEDPWLSEAGQELAETERTP